MGVKWGECLALSLVSSAIYFEGQVISSLISFHAWFEKRKEKKRREKKKKKGCLVDCNPRLHQQNRAGLCREWRVVQYYLVLGLWVFQFPASLSLNSAHNHILSTLILRLSHKHASCSSKIPVKILCCLQFSYETEPACVLCSRTELACCLKLQRCPRELRSRPASRSKLAEGERVSSW